MAEEKPDCPTCKTDEYVSQVTSSFDGSYETWDCARCGETFEVETE